MTFSFDKSLPLRSELWVDSISGCSMEVFSAVGKTDRICVKILGQEFSQGPYSEISLFLNSSQIEALINTLNETKAPVS